MEKGKFEWQYQLMEEYIIKYSTYLYYHWVRQSTFLKVLASYQSNVGCKLPSLPLHHTLKYIPIVYTSIANVTLNWKKNIDFYEVFVSNEKMKIYAIEHYPYLTHFLIF